MTGYGFCGPMTASGTVFDAKAASASQVPKATRYRYGYRAGWVNTLLWLAVEAWL